MGKVFIAGGGKMNVPSAGVLASSLAVGSIVTLMENNQPVDYLVVHQGLPGPMYDASCDGCWVLRKDIFGEKVWSSSNLNDYENSTVNLYLNNEFYNSFGAIEKSIIKQVKIPYRKGAGTSTAASNGANGLSVKIFLVSEREVGGFQKKTAALGQTLSYFLNTNTAIEPKRVWKYRNQPMEWWTRSPETSLNNSAETVKTDGNFTFYSCENPKGIMPALILPSNALFDKATMQLKGIKGGM